MKTTNDPNFCAAQRRHDNELPEPEAPDTEGPTPEESGWESCDEERSRLAAEHAMDLRTEGLI